MLYLEDYLEMIEHLPHELKDRFFEMREMDLQVQNSVDELEKKVKFLFSNAHKAKDEERDREYSEIRKAYMKSLEVAEEKVQMATSFHEMVERYLKRLEVECHKFKMELEADNRGITEILEKRSLDLDQPSQGSSSQKENLCVRSSHLIDHSRRMIRRESSLNDRHRGPDRALEDLPITPQTSALPNYNLTHIAGGNAIAAAASQAIVATQQMQQGRRTASLKASYEAINTGVHAHELSIGRELAGAAHTALQASNHDARKHKKMAAQNQIMDVPMEDEGGAADGGQDGDWAYDPNEPRYCLCNQVSYGDMVACDNEDCPFEWFHYPCVDITCPPKGKWFCPTCTTQMRRRGHKKN